MAGHAEFTYEGNSSFIQSWKEVVQKDCQARNLNKEDAMGRGRWKKLIKTG